MSDDIAKIVGKAMFDQLVKDDDCWCFCGGEAPDGVTLDGMFDLVELAKVAIEAYEAERGGGCCDRHGSHQA